MNIKTDFMWNSFLYSLLFCVVLILSLIIQRGCESSEQSFIRAINQTNKSCPIRLTKEQILYKVEYINHEVIFDITVNEIDYCLNDYTNQELIELENNSEARNELIRLIFNNSIIYDAFKGISQKDDSKVDLRLKAVLKGIDSNKVIIINFSWREAQQNVFRKQ